MKKAVRLAILWMGSLGLPGSAGAWSSEAVVEGIRLDGGGAQPVWAFVASTDRVLPQIATGGDGRNGFFMIFEIVNITDKQVEVSVLFADQQAGSMTLPLAPSGELVSGLRATIPPGGVAFARTLPVGPPKVGWAVVEAPADPSGLGLSVGVTAVFNQVVPGRPLSQAAVPVSTALHDKLFVPYLNTGGFTGTVAILSVAPQRVTFIARNTAGTELCRSSRLMGQGEHTAFVIGQQLSCAANQDGVLEVSGTASGLSGIGFLVQDDGSFGTQIVYGMLPKAP